MNKKILGKSKLPNSNVYDMIFSLFFMFYWWQHIRAKVSIWYWCRCTMNKYYWFTLCWVINNWNRFIVFLLSYDNSYPLNRFAEANRYMYQRMAMGITDFPIDYLCDWSNHFGRDEGPLCERLDPILVYQECGVHEVILKLDFGYWKFKFCHL